MRDPAHVARSAHPLISPSGWDRFEHRGAGGAAWENVKDAVRDAWHRITGQHDLDVERMSESNVSKSSRTR
jgi:hypothetical protein